jgi:hypothetical protein
MRGSFEEIIYEIFESGVVSCWKAALEDRTKTWPVLCEQPKTALRPPNIAGQNHRRQIRLTN